MLISCLIRGLNDTDRIQVFRKFGIQIGDVVHSFSIIEDELDEGEGSSHVLDDGMDLPDLDGLFRFFWMQCPQDTLRVEANFDLEHGRRFIREDRLNVIPNIFRGGFSDRQS